MECPRNVLGWHLFEFHISACHLSAYLNFHKAGQISVRMIAYSSYFMLRFYVSKMSKVGHYSSGKCLSIAVILGQFYGGTYLIG